MHLTATDLTYQTHWVDTIDSMLKRYGVKPIDHLLVLHAESEDEQIFGPVEVVAPVDERTVDILITRSEGRLTRCELPASPHIASTLHHGAPSMAFSAYQVIGSWMENNGYTIVGPRRKICLRQGENLDDTLTEIQFPVEKLA